MLDCQADFDSQRADHSSCILSTRNYVIETTRFQTNLQPKFPKAICKSNAY